MKTIENVTLYKCDHCGKNLQMKHAMIKHEKSCYYNPENTTVCIGCKFLDKKDIDLYYEMFDGEHVRSVNVFYCSKIDSALFPITMDHNKAFEFVDVENQPMLKECKEFSNDF